MVVEQAHMLTVAEAARAGFLRVQDAAGRALASAQVGHAGKDGVALKISGAVNSLNGQRLACRSSSGSDASPTSAANLAWRGTPNVSADRIRSKYTPSRQRCCGRVTFIEQIMNKGVV